MKTTEIFIEQVLIGLLALFVVGALAFPEFGAPLLGAQTLNGDGVGGGLGMAAIVVAVAYIIGIVYDRSADTLLENLHRHHRLISALREYDSGAVPAGDPFPENRYRMNLLRSEAAVDQAHYLRIRMRLTRSLATLTPAVAAALGVHFPEPVAADARVTVGLLIAAAYVAAFSVNFLPTRELNRSRRGGSPGTLERLSRPRLPRTAELRKRDMRESYASYIRYDRAQHAPSTGWLRLALRTEPVMWILLAVTAGSALLLGQATGWSRAALGVPILGLLLTLLFAWTWWRISETYFTFLRDFTNHFSLEAPANGYQPRPSGG